MFTILAALALGQCNCGGAGIQTFAPVQSFQQSFAPSFGTVAFQSGFQQSFAPVFVPQPVFAQPLFLQSGFGVNVNVNRGLFARGGFGVGRGVFAPRVNVNVNRGLFRGGLFGQRVH